MDEIITIDLFGEEFRFRPDGEVKHPGQIAKHLEAYIKKSQDLLKNDSGPRNKLIILLLAAMNLAKDHQELQMQHDELQQMVDHKISTLIYKIEKGLDTPNQ